MDPSFNKDVFEKHLTLYRYLYCSKDLFMDLLDKHLNYTYKPYCLKDLFEF